jgi:hypothetical protein
MHEDKHKKLLVGYFVSFVNFMVKSNRKPVMTSLSAD